MRKTKATRSAIAKRLGEAMERAGYRTRVSLAAAMEKAGYPITDEALGAYFRGDALPRSEVLVGLRKVLGVSIDWLLTGEETTPPDVKQLNDLLDHFAAKLGLREQQLDPQIQKIIRIAIKLPPEQRAQLARLVDTYEDKEAT